MMNESIKQLLIALAVAVALAGIVLLLTPAIKYCHQKFYMRLYQQTDTFALLEAVTGTQKEKGLFGRTAPVWQAPPHIKLVIISNIDGQVNSFTAIIKELERMNILKSNKIVEPSAYLIFNGNMIGNASDSLSILDTIATLQKNDPEHIWYIRGTHEDREQWKSQSLGQYIQLISPDNDSTIKITRNFFNTLPIGIYMYLEQEKQPMRISYFGPESSEYDLISCQKKEAGIVSSLCTFNEYCSFNRRSLQQHNRLDQADMPAAYFIGDPSTIKEPMPSGLHFTSPPATWTLISAPTLTFKQQFGLIKETFVIINVQKTFETSEILLYQKDGDNFKHTQSTNLAHK